MDKPKGGRGHAAPYETKQMRVPVGLEPQIQELISRYREWISKCRSEVADANNPPRLLDKPVDNFNDANKQAGFRGEASPRNTAPVWETKVESFLGEFSRRDRA